MLQFISVYKNQLWIVVLLSILINVNTLNHEYTIDDRIVVTNNTLTQEGISAIPKIFSHSYLYGYNGREDESYRPLTLVTFALERSFFDASPRAAHLIQILLYLCCILVLFKWLRLLFEEENKLIAFVVTLLFVVHPIHTEVIANVKSRDELLGALFLFMACFQFTKWLVSEQSSHLMWTLFFFLLGMLSKDNIVAGIGIFPLIAWFKGNGVTRKTLIGLGYLLVPLSLYFAIRSIVLNDILIEDSIDPVSNAIAAASSNSEAWGLKLGIFSKYIQLGIWPVTQSWDYSIAQFSPSGWDSKSIIGLIGLIGLILIALFGGIKKNYVGFGAAFFLITIALTSNFFFLINCTLGERFLFLPSLGLIILIVVFLFKVNKRLLPITWMSITGVVVLYFSVATIARNTDWKSNLTIYSAGVISAPKSVKTHFNLGTEYIEQANIQSNISKRKAYLIMSKDEFEKCIELYPNYDLIYENLGYVYGELGKLSKDKNEALTIYRRGEETLLSAMADFNIDRVGLEQNINFLQVQLYAESKDEEEKRAVRNRLIDGHLKLPLVKEDYIALAYYYREGEKLDSVEWALMELAKISKEDAVHLKEFAREKFEQNELDESLRIINTYLKIVPDDLQGQTNKAMLLEIKGEIKEAIRLYEAVLEKNPDIQPALNLYTNLKKRTLR